MLALGPKRRAKRRQNRTGSLAAAQGAGQTSRSRFAARRSPGEVAALDGADPEAGTGPENRSSGEAGAGSRWTRIAASGGSFRFHAGVDSDASIVSVTATVGDHEPHSQLTLSAVDRSHATDLYEQVAAEIRRAIADGEARPEGAAWRRRATLLLCHGWSRRSTSATGCRCSSKATTSEPMGEAPAIPSKAGVAITGAVLLLVGERRSPKPAALALQFVAKRLVSGTGVDWPLVVVGHQISDESGSRPASELGAKAKAAGPFALGALEVSFGRPSAAWSRARRPAPATPRRQSSFHFDIGRLLAAGGCQQRCPLVGCRSLGVGRAR
jgi:hypothetical protein